MKIEDSLGHVRGIKGDYTQASFAKVLIVAARFNATITKALLVEVENVLAESGCDKATIIWVPGAFEIPLATDLAIQEYHPDVVICLGAVIRGETPHFDFVAQEVSKGTMDVSLKRGVPVILGVLTTDSLSQAEDRCSVSGLNKGREFGIAALEMVSLFDQISGPKAT
ncbi:MAG: 6,7-dimethyl-8-ribityllumazine synthase [Actinobacteria bacterium]|nr:6,7-dimethyl-8-ribityllumazine synthase [Actinomycetota bacterium]